MKKMWLLVVFGLLLMQGSTGLAQFKKKAATSSVSTDAATSSVSTGAATGDTTTYTGSFSAYVGFVGVVGMNINNLYQGEVNVKRGFDDESYLNIFITMRPHPEDPQLFGIGYGKLLMQPVTNGWLFLNAAFLFSEAGDPNSRNYVGVPVGLELKYDFTEFAALSLRVDAMPAYNFDEFGAGLIGQAGLTLTP